MKNYKLHREQVIDNLNSQLNPVHWQWRTDRCNEITIYHIDTNWKKGKAVYIPNIFNAIFIKLDMQNRLELQAKALKEIRLLFGLSK